MAPVITMRVTRGSARAFLRCCKSGTQVPALVNAITPSLEYRNTSENGNKKNVCI